MNLTPLRVNRFHLVFFGVLIFCASALSGCLQDTITGPQVVPRLVLQPFSARFIAINYVAPDHGDMIVRWSRSLGDTQLNFKGYFVKLFQSTAPPDSVTDGTEAIKFPPLDSGYVYRVGNRLADTSIIFKSKDSGRYTVWIYGVHSADTIRLSSDSLQYSSWFDPRPLTNPTNLRATSISPTQVKLRWDSSTTEKYMGFLGYAVYARDPSNTSPFKDSARLLVTLPAGTAREYIAQAVPFSPPTQTTTTTAVEHSNGYFVKSVRFDSTIVWGATDSNMIIWAGAQPVPAQTGTDTGSGFNSNSGYRMIHNSMYFGTFGSQPDVVDDSNRTDKQVTVTFSNGSVTLAAGIGATFLNSGEPLTHQVWDSSARFYTTPITSGSVATITLDSSSTDTTGRLIYLQFNDLTDGLPNQPEYARFFVHRQLNGSFINPDNGGIDIKGYYQPGITSTGTAAHLPYY